MNSWWKINLLRAAEIVGTASAVWVLRYGIEEASFLWGVGAGLLAIGVVLASYRRDDAVEASVEGPIKASYQAAAEKLRGRLAAPRVMRGAIPADLVDACEALRSEAELVGRQVIAVIERSHRIGDILVGVDANLAAVNADRDRLAERDAVLTQAAIGLEQVREIIASADTYAVPAVQDLEPMAAEEPAPELPKFLREQRPWPDEEFPGELAADNRAKPA